MNTMVTNTRRWFIALAIAAMVATTAYSVPQLMEGSAAVMDADLIAAGGTNIQHG